MGVEACCTCVSFRSTYTLDFNNSSFIMSNYENYETTFNHLRSNFCTRYKCLYIYFYLVQKFDIKKKLSSCFV
jgi:hypothetical protein